MSSIRYSAELTPDPRLRRVVIGVGSLAASAGLIAIAAMNLAWSAKTALALVWSLVSGRDLLRTERGNKACCRIQIDASGALQVYDSAGCCTSATIEPGSVVLQSAAWLRFRTCEGLRHAELLGRDSAGVHEWRRFQVIWRHLGATA